jgi:large subunit ribosomal protein L23
MNKLKNTNTEILELSLDSTLSLFYGCILLNGIKQISLTKKSLWSLENKKYTFFVSPFMTKPFIKLSIENYFNARVQKINTLNLPTRKKYVGYKDNLKKAVLTFDSNEKVALFSDI